MRTEYWVLLASISCHSIWHVIGKAALTVADPEPFTFIFYRCIFAGVLLVTVATLTAGVPTGEAMTKLVESTKQTMVWLIFLGVCMATNAVCFLQALKMSSPAVCAVLQPTIPVFVFLLSLAVEGGGDSFTTRKAAGVTLAALGAAAAAGAYQGASVLDEANREAAEYLYKAFVLLIVQCFCMALILIFQKRLLHMYPSVSSFLFMGLIYVFSSAILLPFAIAYGGWSLENEPRVWLALGYCVVFATAFSYGGIAWASKRGVESTTVSVFITVEPFITAGLARFFLQASPDKPVLFLVCAGLVAAGVALVLDKDGAAKYEPVKESEEADAEVANSRRSISIGKAQQA